MFVVVFFLPWYRNIRPNINSRQEQQTPLRLMAYLEVRFLVFYRDLQIVINEERAFLILIKYGFLFF